MDQSTHRRMFAKRYWHPVGTGPERFTACIGSTCMYALRTTSDAITTRVVLLGFSIESLYTVQQVRATQHRC